jgi:hypothetical protein
VCGNSCVRHVAVFLMPFRDQRGRYGWSLGSIRGEIHEGEESREGLEENTVETEFK